MIRPVTVGDAEAIVNLYNYYIENSDATFEETPLSVSEMAGRIEKISARFPYFVYEDEAAPGKAGVAGVPHAILGYAYVNTWKERVSYRFSAEDSVYVKHGYERRGIGKALFARLLDEVKKAGELHAIVAGITLPNVPSTSLHEKFGFEKIAVFKEIGFKFDNWLDVGYWELIINGN